MNSVNNSLSRNKSDYGEYSSDLETTSLSNHETTSKKSNPDSDFFDIPKIDIAEIKESIAKKELVNHSKKEIGNELQNEISDLNTIINIKDNEINELKNRLSGGGELEIKLEETESKLLDSESKLEKANNEMNELKNKLSGGDSELQKGGVAADQKARAKQISEIISLMDIEGIDMNDTNNYYGLYLPGVEENARLDKIISGSKKFVENAIKEKENNELLLLTLMTQSMYNQNNQVYVDNHNDMNKLYTEGLETESVGGDNKQQLKSLEQSQLENILEQTKNEIEKGSDVIKELRKTNDNRYNHTIIKYSDKLVNLEQIKADIIGDLESYTKKDMLIAVGGDESSLHKNVSPSTPISSVSGGDSGNESLILEKKQLKNMLKLTNNEIKQVNNGDLSKLKKLKKLRKNIERDLNNMI